MSKIYAGTAFGQIVQIDLNNKKKNIKRLGNMKKQKILNMQFQPNYDYLYYHSQKHVYQYNFSTSIQQAVDEFYSQSDKIVNFQLFQDYLVYGISNGSIVNIKKDKSTVNLLTQSIKGQGEYKKFVYNEKDLILMVGKNVLPFVYDINKVVVSWRGRNVPNDYLDLQVPINDVDALFFNQKNIACANSDNKVRLYDVRGNKTKPYEDIHLKLQKTYSKTFLTKIISSSDANYFYIGNNVGGIYQCDLRKNLAVTGKFKGISTTITDLLIDGQYLYSTSLDCYIRKFNIQTRQQQQKFYTNKALHSICLLKEGQTSQQFAQQQLALDQDEQEQSKKITKKMKQMRKRNKIGLKYLQPVNWDDVELKYQHQSDQQVKSQGQQLNSKDRYQEEQSLKNQNQDFGQEEDSDLQDRSNQ